MFASVCQSNTSVAFCFVVGFLYIGTGHRNCVALALTRTSRVFPTRVFSKMHKMSSLALPACCLPRSNPFSSILGTFSECCARTIFTTIHSGIALLATIIVDRVQTRRSHLTVGHQRGKCIGSNCVRPRGLASVDCVCFMYGVCWVGNVFQSVNGNNLLLVQMVGVPTIEMCAMPERETSGFAGGAHGFSHYDRVFFLMWLSKISLR